MKKLVIILATCTSGILMAATVEFDATKDATIAESDSTTNYGADYFLDLWGGSDMPPTPDEMTLVEFFGLNELTAAGSAIDNAVLRLYMTTFLDDGEVLFYRVGDEWSEMDVTWNTRPDSNKGITVTNALPTNPGVWFETNVTTIVRSWVEDKYPNRGFYIVVPVQGTGVQTGAQFASRENTIVNNPPRLFVEYHLTGAIEERVARVSIGDFTATSDGEIRFSLTSPSPISLDVYDASGALVKTLAEGSMSAGTHHFSWDADKGVYFVRLATSTESLVRKVVLVD